MKKTRCRIDSALKAKIALEALREQTPIAHLAEQYGVYPSKIYAWKKQLENDAIYLFDKRLLKLRAKIDRIINSIKPNSN